MGGRVNPVADASGSVRFRRSCCNTLEITDRRACVSLEKAYNFHRSGIGISVVPSLPKAVRRVRLPYPALLNLYIIST